ncbi:MAG: hypothetical protein ACM34N_17055 [Ignavibacteria bacterium]
MMIRNDLKKIKRKRNSSTETKKDLSESYNKFKEFEGQIYTGAKVGRGQRWYYKTGEWKEKKVAPDRWEFTYEVPKRRAGKAPPGSGAPVGTEYHWYILAHQLVRKLDANNYSTSMSGLKYKLSHKRADKDKWNSSDRTQRKRLIKILTDLADQLVKRNN